MAELCRIVDVLAAADIANAEAASTTHPWSSTMYAESIEGQDQVFAYHAEQQQAIGFAVLLQVLDEAHLQNVFICQPWQRLGHGRQLLQQLMQHAAKQGASRMLLEVRESNLAARQLYLSCGFRETGQRKHYYRTDSGPREHAILMEAQL
ncbi:ribosomal protein S18-alanine N-acetyltransferase [Vogesella sp. GCM10023246]|uniref:[Ribosomal protein bS18]-alanine N-acetyltransferase n=1 Tax=Vogesella oryzagri TaxID=3160864 RepID=A0ABV1M668_9NEIS